MPYFFYICRKPPKSYLSSRTGHLAGGFRWRWIDAKKTEKSFTRQWD